MASARPGGPAVPARLPSLAMLVRDPPILTTTIAFMAFNVAEGMLMVTAPWLARNRLPGGAAMLGSLLAALATGEISGAALAGQRQPRRSRVRAIGLTQAAAGSAFLTLLVAPGKLLASAGFFAVGLFSAPMTIWAQSLRMQRIPPALRGWAFAVLRTLMQATPPLGAALATPFLAQGNLAGAAAAMAAVAIAPAACLIIAAPGQAAARSESLARSESPVR